MFQVSSVTLIKIFHQKTNVVKFKKHMQLVQFVSSVYKFVSSVYKRVTGNMTIFPVFHIHQIQCMAFPL